ncbi:MAG: gamma-glutamyltransferase family protein [Alphaproteobacteria bacterium]|nr:gamma-glutamyltransferase family protein [Alphaproteobacteria bacterium]
MGRIKGVSRFLIVSAIFGTVLAGCGDSRIGRTLDTILPDPATYLYGAAVADDPSAVVAAQEILTRGGTAADAAVALYFTLSVTMPSVASLGGGGVCLVHDPKSRQTERLDFIAPKPTGPLTGADRPSAVPANVRGMAVLYQRFGRLPWENLLANAENLARAGTFVSKPLAQDLARAGGPLFADPEARRLFTLETGGPLPAGDPVRQIELGAAIAQIRARGAGAFYSGPLGDRLVDGVRRAGGTLTKRELRNFMPRWRTALSVDFGTQRFHVAGPPAAAGAVAAQMWQMLVTDDRYTKTPAEERAHLLAEVSRRAFAQRRRWLGANGDVSALSAQLLSPAYARQLMQNYDPARATPIDGYTAQADGKSENAAASGFIVVDGSGMAVACTVTMYNLFGTGRVVPGVGIFLAQAPGVGSRNPLSLGPVVVTDIAGREFRFAAAGAGGAAVPSSTVNVAIRALLDRQPLKDASASGRIHAEASSDTVMVEANETVPRMETLSRRGHPVRRHYGLGRVNAINCPGGVPPKSFKRDLCQAEADRRGGGLGVTVLIEQG